MKAQEYFEMFFKDLEPTLPNIVESAKQMLSEFSGEITPLIQKRRSNSNSAIEGIVRELNQKWNSVVEKVHKHFGFKCLNRNVIWNLFLADEFPHLYKRKPN